MVSDGSRPPARIGPGNSAAAGVQLTCTLIAELSGLPVIGEIFPADGPLQLLARLGELPPAVAAVFLYGVTAESARLVRQALADSGGPAVLTEQDAIAVAMAAASVTKLSRAGRVLSRSRVVISGADAAPLLSPLLMAADVGEIDRWNPVDGLKFGLSRLAYGADLVLDLLDRIPQPREVGSGHPPVIGPAGQLCNALTMPGLLRAVVRSRHPRLTIEVFFDCVKALSAATPAGLLLPELPDDELTDMVAAAANGALHRRQTAAVPTR